MDDYGPATRPARSPACLARERNAEGKDAAVSPTREHTRVLRSPRVPLSSGIAAFSQRPRERYRDSVSRAARTTGSISLRAPAPRIAHRRFPVGTRRTGGSARPEVKLARPTLVFKEDPRRPHDGFAPEHRTAPAPSSPPDDHRGWVVLGIVPVGLGPTSVHLDFRLDARSRTGCLSPPTKVEEPEPLSSPPAGEPARGTPFVPAISRRP